MRPVRTTVWLLLALFAGAALACTKATPGYCGPPAGPSVCLSEGMLCNQATNLCEAPDAGTPPTAGRTGSAGSGGADGGGDAREGGTDARDGAADANGDVSEPTFQRCDGGAGCPSGKSCVDGICCASASASCGECQSCAIPGREGTCQPVSNLDTDENSGCVGDRVCNGAAECKTKEGRPCQMAIECLSLFCADGVCCNQACDGTCYACNQTDSLGACRPLHGVEDPQASAPCTGSSTCVVPGGAAPACKLKDGQVCAANDACANSSCLTSYPDADGDGYGGAAVRRCATALPPGHITTGGDCCDMDARARPGVTAYSSTENNCGSWDFNCDGMAEREMGATQACGCTTAGPITLCVACR